MVASGTRRIVLLIVVAALAFGVGFFVARPSEAEVQSNAPTAQTVADFLSRPLPVPPGAQELEISHGSTGGGLGGGSLQWERWIVLDVTRIELVKIQDLPGFYADYFEQPLGLPAYSFTTNVPCRFPDGQFYMAGGGGWTGLWRLSAFSRHLNLLIDAEVYDLAPDPERPSRWNRSPVRILNLTELPAGGMRVMILHIRLFGHDLQGEAKAQFSR